MLGRRARQGHERTPAALRAGGRTDRLAFASRIAVASLAEGAMCEAPITSC